MSAFKVGDRVSFSGEIGYDDMVFNSIEGVVLHDSIDSIGVQFNVNISGHSEGGLYGHCWNFSNNLDYTHHINMLTKIEEQKEPTKTSTYFITKTETYHFEVEGAYLDLSREQALKLFSSLEGALF